MKKYTIVSLALIASLFGAPLFAGERSGDACGAAFSVKVVDKNFWTASPQLHALVAEMDLFLACVHGFNTMLAQQEHYLLNWPGTPTASVRAELALIAQLKELNGTCLDACVEFRSITTKEAFLHNLRAIAQLLHAVSCSLPNEMSWRQIDAIVRTLFRGRLYDNALALILGIPCQEQGKVDDVFVRALMSRAALVPECAKLAPACEKTYHDYFDTSLAETEAKISSGLLFLEQLAELLDGMLNHLKN